MGYCFQVVDSVFKIRKENLKKTLKAIQSLHGKETITDSSGEHFSWVKKDFYKLKTVKEILEEWRWEPQFDGDENIEGIVFIGEKIGNDNILFETIAPLVENGSYIDCIGEDAQAWRWKFIDGKFEEKALKLVEN